jgi:serine/threonine protein kinase
MFLEKDLVVIETNLIFGYNGLIRVKNLKTDICYLVRTLVYYTEKNAENKLEDLILYEELHHEGLLKVYRSDLSIADIMEDEKDKKQRLQFTIKVFMENASETLENQFRKKNANHETFTYRELNLLIKCLLDGCSYLEENNVKIRDITPQNIFYIKECGTNLYKIADLSEIKDLLSGESNECTSLFQKSLDYIDPITKDIFLFKRDIFTKKLEIIPAYNCSIYSIALLIIEAMTGESVKGINNLENKNLKFTLFIILGKILSKYGYAWARLAKLLLKPSEKNKLYKVAELIKNENLDQAMLWNEKVRINNY